MIYTTDILGDQWEIFFGSLMLGVLLGFCYDFIRAAKIIFSFRKKAAIAADVIYSVWAGFLVFSFLAGKEFRNSADLYIYRRAAWIFGMVFHFRKSYALAFKAC